MTWREMRAIAYQESLALRYLFNIYGPALRVAPTRWDWT